MIKFFRKIRFDLMEKNKTAKYFKYAIGEIVLVVIGILIALSLNSWNNNRLDRIAEKRYLESFKNDIELQLERLERLDILLSEKIDYAESLLANYQETESFRKVDSFSYKMSKLMGTSAFPNINTTFSEINSSGQIGIIRNDSLRQQLIDFYQFNDSFENSYKTNINNVFYPLIFSDFKSSMQIDLEDFGYKSSRIDSDQVFEKHSLFLKTKLENPEVELKIINGLSLRILFTTVNNGAVLNSKNRCNTLLELIKNQANI